MVTPDGDIAVPTKAGSVELRGPQTALVGDTGPLLPRYDGFLLAGFVTGSSIPFPGRTHREPALPSLSGC